MLTAPRPEYLATAEEQIAGERIALIEKRLGDSSDPESLALRQRAARLRGALTWRLGTENNEPLTAVNLHQYKIKAPRNSLHTRYSAFVRTTQVAARRYVGYGV